MKGNQGGIKPTNWEDLPEWVKEHLLDPNMKLNFCKLHSVFYDDGISCCDVWLILGNGVNIRSLRMMWVGFATCAAAAYANVSDRAMQDFTDELKAWAQLQHETEEAKEKHERCVLGRWVLCLDCWLCIMPVAY